MLIERSLSNILSEMISDVNLPEKKSQAVQREHIHIGELSWYINQA